MNAYARLDKDTLRVGNRLVERRFRWGGGNLATLGIADKRSGAEWPCPASVPDLHFPGETAPPRGGRLRVREVPATSVTPAHLEAVVALRIGALQVRRVFRIFLDAPAISSELHLRGRARGPWAESQGEARAALESPENDRLLWGGAFSAPLLDRIATSLRHTGAECVRFMDVTDRRNTLVHRQAFLPYRSPVYSAGNVLFARRALTGAGLFVLKEAPCSDMQLGYPGCDFVCTEHGLLVTGLGLRLGDLSETEWTRAYGCVTGVFAGGDDEALLALRRWQEASRARRPDRDDMILANTWGDRGGAKRVTEEFLLAEVRAAARLGLTHVQVDAGWQKGREPYTVAGGDLKNIWTTPDFWAENPARLPRGLGPIVALAGRLGIRFGAWFNPSPEGGYANWADDARVLVGLLRRHGIRMFKIDGVEVPDRAAERNLRRMLDRVQAAAGGEAVFNLDITAGQRFGYHYFNEYGNKFLENRYTDWGNYYPHWTLRNLWHLSAWVPPQSLQIEFLNPWRNPDKYPKDDPLAPARVPFAYCFAITMMAQPLAWFEASSLPEEAFAIAPLIRTYRRHMARIHANPILPIGEEPDGTGWTGFQSVGARSGYILVFREYNERPAAKLRLIGLAGRRIACRAVAGDARDFTATVDTDGRATFHLPQSFSFALYRY